MPDTYIDYDEVSEYGRNLVSALTPLDGKSTLVNVANLAALVTTNVDVVENELQQARHDRRF